MLQGTLLLPDDALELARELDRNSRRPWSQWSSRNGAGVYRVEHRSPLSCLEWWAPVPALPCPLT